MPQEFQSLPEGTRVSATTMKKIVLASGDFSRHMTNENFLMQRGFEQQGWELCGWGYDTNLTDVPMILAALKPDIVFQMDRRDWDKDSPGCFDPRVHFSRVEALADHPEIFKVAMVKDAGSAVNYQRASCEVIDADAIVMFYHDASAIPYSEFLKNYPRIRTYHTVDRDVCETMPLAKERRRGIVSGAVSSVYPLRRQAFRSAYALGIDVQDHPGYSNRGCQTNDYLRLLNCYRVHVATSSRYGFAVRKIMESVAMGCTPVTDLPIHDRLPEIDGALVRVSSRDCSINELSDAINRADRDWDFERVSAFAEKARAFYDYRAVGKRMSDRIIELAMEKLCGSASKMTA